MGIRRPTRRRVPKGRSALYEQEQAHRLRLGRIARLRTLLSERGDTAKLAKLDEVSAKESQRYQRFTDIQKRKLAPDESARAATSQAHRQSRRRPLSRKSQMNTSSLVAICLGALLSSCTGASHNSTDSNARVAQAGATNAEPSILSQDECDRQAATGITAANCDAELDKRVHEIDADPATGG